MSIPTPTEQASRYALMVDQVTGQGYRGDVVPLRAARLTLAEFRPADVVIAHPEAWAPTCAVWVDPDGNVWPQAAYTANDLDIRGRIIGRALERGQVEVLRRIGGRCWRSKLQP